ncbi:MAG: hypothetical protein DI533_17005 [Cereibacter sphaeroides]|uniref:Uncharacterized protein n=1 Tax=Cereibacter sphaeroides TaxID=1063 RepID=A0A2W5S215_CERSP|nr:MAG: hypothetical protein DI533_17005 [Cereibacter sphaeroides]
MSAPEPILIGLDLGSTNLKGVATKADGSIVAIARRPMVVVHGANGAADFDLAALDRNVVAMLRELVDVLAGSGIPASAVAGIGVASIGEAFTGIDGSGNRLGPCPTWYDRRTAPGRQALGLSTKAWFEITGMVDDDIYSVHRLRWWRAKNEGWFNRVKYWLMVSDYVVWLMTGVRSTSPSLAARSGMADRTKVDWSDEILAAAGVERSSLPQILPAASVAGDVTEHFAAQTGLVIGTPVVNAGHDHPCAGLGCGLVDPGQVIDSTGTSEAMKSVLTHPLGFEELGGGLYDCYPHVVPGRWLLSGHIPSGGGLLDWLVQLLSGPVPDAESAERLWEMAEAAPAGAEGAVVEPFLSGTGQPLNQRDRRAVISGLSGDVGAGEILRAGTEALAGWVSANLALFERFTGHVVSELILTGGGARNTLSNRIKAALINRPLLLPQADETAGLGAALVAGIGAGVFPTPTSAAARPAIAVIRVEPDPALVAAYEPLHARLTQPWAQADV